MAAKINNISVDQSPTPRKRKRSRPSHSESAVKRTSSQRTPSKRAAKVSISMRDLESSDSDEDIELISSQLEDSLMDPLKDEHEVLVCNELPTPILPTPILPTPSPVKPIRKKVFSAPSTSSFQTVFVPADLPQVITPPNSLEDLPSPEASTSSQSAVDVKTRLMADFEWKKRPSIALGKSATPAAPAPALKVKKPSPLGLSDIFELFKPTATLPPYVEHVYSPTPKAEDIITPEPLSDDDIDDMFDNGVFDDDDDEVTNEPFQKIEAIAHVTESQKMVFDDVEEIPSVVAVLPEPVVKKCSLIKAEKPIMPVVALIEQVAESPQEEEVPLVTVVPVVLAPRRCKPEPAQVENAAKAVTSPVVPTPAAPLLSVSLQDLNPLVQFVSKAKQAPVETSDLNPLVNFKPKTAPSTETVVDTIVDTLVETSDLNPLVNFKPKTAPSTETVVDTIVDTVVETKELKSFDIETEVDVEVPSVDDELIAQSTVPCAYEMEIQNPDTDSQDSQESQTDESMSEADPETKVKSVAKQEKRSVQRNRRLNRLSKKLSIDCVLSGTRRSRTRLSSSCTEQPKDEVKVLRSRKISTSASPEKKVMKSTTPKKVKKSATPRKSTPRAITPVKKTLPSPTVISRPTTPSSLVLEPAPDSVPVLELTSPTILESPAAGSTAAVLAVLTPVEPVQTLVAVTSTLLAISSDAVMISDDDEEDESLEIISSPLDDDLEIVSPPSPLPSELAEPVLPPQSPALPPSSSGSQVLTLALNNVTSPMPEFSRDLSDFQTDFSLSTPEPVKRKRKRTKAPKPEKSPKITIKNLFKLHRPSPLLERCALTKYQVTPPAPIVDLTRSRESTPLLEIAESRGTTPDRDLEIDIDGSDEEFSAEFRKMHQPSEVVLPEITESFYDMVTKDVPGDSVLRAMVDTSEKPRAEPVDKGDYTDYSMMRNHQGKTFNSLKKLFKTRITDRPNDPDYEYMSKTFINNRTYLGSPIAIIINRLIKDQLIAPQQVEDQSTAVQSFLTLCHTMAQSNGLGDINIYREVMNNFFGVLKVSKPDKKSTKFLNTVKFVVEFSVQSGELEQLRSFIISLILKKDPTTYRQLQLVMSECLSNYSPFVLIGTEQLGYNEADKLILFPAQRLYLAGLEFYLRFTLYREFSGVDKLRYVHQFAVEGHLMGLALNALESEQHNQQVCTN